MTDEQLKELVETYEPNAQVVKAAGDIKMLATVGPSASGKTTLMRALAAKDPDFKLVVGETSRPLRPNEDGTIDMITRSKEDILTDLKNGELLQVVRGPNGDFYCTRPSSFPAEGIGLFPLVPLGVRQFRALPLSFFAAAFIVPASFEAWQEWLKKQAEISGWSKEKLAQRLGEAKESYEFALNDKQIHFVLNDQVEKAVQRLAQVGRGQTPDDEEQARLVATENLRKLG